MNKNKNKNQGFSFMELTIAIVIIILITTVLVEVGIEAETSREAAEQSQNPFADKKKIKSDLVYQQAKEKAKADFTDSMSTASISFFGILGICLFMGTFFALLEKMFGSAERRNARKTSFLRRSAHQGTRFDRIWLHLKIILLCITRLGSGNYYFNWRQSIPKQVLVDVIFMDGSMVSDVHPDDLVLEGRWAYRSSNPIVQYRVAESSKVIHHHFKGCENLKFSHQLNVMLERFDEKLNKTLHHESDLYGRYLSQAKKTESFIHVQLQAGACCDCEAFKKQDKADGADCDALITALSELTQSLDKLSVESITQGTESRSPLTRLLEGNEDLVKSAELSQH